VFGQAGGLQEERGREQPQAGPGNARGRRSRGAGDRGAVKGARGGAGRSMEDPYYCIEGWGGYIGAPHESAPSETRGPVLLLFFFLFFMIM